MSNNLTPEQWMQTYCDDTEQPSAANEMLTAQFRAAMAQAWKEGADVHYAYTKSLIDASNQEEAERLGAMPPLNPYTPKL